MWVGGPEPEWTKAFQQTWERPGWRVEYWDDETVEEFFPLYNQAVYEAAPVLAGDRAGQLRADVLRYEALLKYGGVWVDADLECLRPIDELVEDGPFVPWETWPRWVNNGILAFPPEHPMLLDLIRGLRENVEANLGQRPAAMTGPRYVTQVWKARWQGRVRALPEHFFYPFKWDENGEFVPGEFSPAERWPDAYTVHWWRNKRREAGALPA
jgi:mannosyltransferase OCH1-like enzyme